MKPITSVSVVTNVPEASAGSRPKRSSVSGTSTPPSAATIWFTIMAIASTAPRRGSPKTSIPTSPRIRASPRPFSTPAISSRRITRGAVERFRSRVASARTATASDCVPAIPPVEATIGISGRSTGIGDGLGLALRRLDPRDAHIPEGRPAATKAVVLLSDGANNAGQTTPRDVAVLARDLGKLNPGAQFVVERLHGARHAVLACFNMMIPYIAPDLSAPQRAALSQNVKTPICYTNVLVRNWQAFTALKLQSIHLPMGFHHQVSLDVPVSLGGYKNPRDPSEPMLLHLVHVPGAPNSGLDARAQFRLGREKLYTTTFADFEARIRDELDRILGAGGFASSRDIAAITVNRWPHGYSYVANSLFDPDDYEDRVLKVARQRAGNIAIANTDAGGDAWVHYAIDQADRAVREALYFAINKQTIIDTLNYGLPRQTESFVPQQAWS